MGKPLTISIDKFITYPLIKYIVPFFKYIHPIIITVFNIYIKYLAIYNLSILNINNILIYLTIERLLDCLDGELARTYNKCTKIGHYLDKYSDLLFRASMCFFCWKIAFTYKSLNIYWYILCIFNIICPLAYFIDYINGKIDHKMVSNSNSYSIYIEDNATIICILLPFILYYI